MLQPFASVGAHIWNYNEGTWSRQGFNETTIQVSTTGGTNTSDWSTVFTGNLEQASGDPNDLAQHVDFNGGAGALAKHVILVSTDEIDKNFAAGTNGDVGLAEIWFKFEADDIRGDFNNDGVVDAKDIDLLCAELGGANADFDLTNDGMVNSEDADLMGGATLGDLGILAANFGPDNGPVQAEFEAAVEAALVDLVPEPATASLLVLCSLGVLRRRR